MSPQPADENCRKFHWDMKSNASLLDLSVSMPQQERGTVCTSVCLADASPIPICDLINSAHSLITNNSTCVSCGAMRSVPQMVT